MFVVGADPEHAAGPSLSAADQYRTVNTAAHRVPQCGCWMVIGIVPPLTQSAGLRRSAWAGQHAMVSRRDKHCLCASGAEPEGSRACPARHAHGALARRRGLRRPWGHQPWPGGGWWRPRPACGRRVSFLHILMQRATYMYSGSGGLHAHTSWHARSSDLRSALTSVTVSARETSRAETTGAGNSGHTLWR